MGLNQQIGAGLVFQNSEVYPNKSMQKLYPEDFNYKRYGFSGFGLNATYRLNTLNDILYPFEGKMISVNLTGIYEPFLHVKYLSDTIETESSLSSFGKFYFDYDSYYPLGPKLCLNTGLSIGLSTDEFIASDYFYVGGHKNNLRRNHVAFVGYNLGEVVATNLFCFKMGLNYRLFKNLQIETLLNGMVASDGFKNMINALLEMNDESLHLGYGAGLTYKTMLGPLSIFVAGNNRETNATWYLNFGFTF
jgi:hypothetical protein